MENRSTALSHHAIDCARLAKMHEPGVRPTIMLCGEPNEILARDREHEALGNHAQVRCLAEDPDGARGEG